MGSRLVIKYDPFTNIKEIMHHLDAIKVATDANRGALGFNPSSIKNEKLWVAVDAKDSYLGHIMLG